MNPRSVIVTVMKSREMGPQCQLRLVLSAFLLFVVQLTYANGQCCTTKPAAANSVPKTALERAQRFPVDYEDSKRVDECIRLFETAIAEASNTDDEWCGRFGLFEVLRLSHRDVERQNMLILSVLEDRDWSRERTSQAVLAFLDFQIFDLAESDIRDLDLAEDIATQLISECMQWDEFATRLQAEVKLLRILRENEGVQSALAHGKVLCIEASESIEHGVIDKKRNSSPKRRIANGTAIDNLGLYVAQLVQYMEPMERAAAIKEFDEFMVTNRLRHRIAMALRTGLEEFRTEHQADQSEDLVQAPAKRSWILWLNVFAVVGLSVLVVRKRRLATL
jgi:hypothetical protein